VEEHIASIFKALRVTLVRNQYKACAANRALTLKTEEICSCETSVEFTPPCTALHRRRYYSSDKILFSYQEIFCSKELALSKYL
jgi:hypothetical protein